ncbi:T9SS type A sorting domain-containing protein [candidate division KSB1 bacterium]|nr:T9SS type A sorting domain-containing protein [candidate division KSB1 bacterium]NIR68357.1 T9SS type A sorting domain-containing protein [candidate division KSB1 bacterium]NIS22542.1 T9SS type A sorting domain-containing protein [candidate division KSB1 bacterium]NIT69378.1 T9SS type A sorting domain-containing protein [candidate division KSB1 bacterium]NIU23039.1 T9SS type A sorting domain-containing protein [candidate division KSB1 bacterium]
MLHLQKLTNIAGRKVLIIGWLLSMVSISLAQGDTWTTKADMPTARGLCSASEVDGIIYVIGGTTAESYPMAVATVEAYDLATDTWTKKADMPGVRWGLSTCALNGKIYAIGGGRQDFAPAISVVEEYDPATDTWTRKADMPSPRAYLGTSAVDGKIYAIGGMSYGSEYSVVEAYDPAADTWTRKTDMPTARNYLAASVVNGKIYAIGGAMGYSDIELSRVEEYDPLTDTWTRKKEMPTSRLYLSTSAVNARIYAIGGAKGRFEPGLTTVEEYHPETDTWTSKADMPTPRVYLTTCAVNGKIYAIGGATRGDPSAFVTTVQEYTPPVVTSVESEPRSEINPVEFTLHQNCPNPFNPVTVISYELSAASEVELTIYNQLGQRVKTLVNEKQPAGVYRVQWDGKSEDGVQLSSGVYIYRIKAGDFVDAKKLALIR